MVEKPARHPGGNVQLAAGAPGLEFQVRGVRTGGRNGERW